MLLNKMRGNLICQLILRSISTTATRAAKESTINKNRLKLFESIADDWWNPKGIVSSLHLLTQSRIQFITQNINEKKVAIKLIDGHYKDDVLKGLDILDVGCGAGIVSENLASLGANVIGIDPSEILIQIAKHHLKTSPISMVSPVKYIQTTVEDHVKEHRDKFDVVIVFLVLEHIQNRHQFLSDCYTLLKPGGSLFVQTVNRNWMNILWFLWFTNVVKVAPRKVALVSQLIKTTELIDELKSIGLHSPTVDGIRFSILGNKIHWTKSMPYIHCIHTIK